MKRLRLDQRLIRRRGWISKQDLERELSALPDVSDKIRPPDPEDADEDGGVAPAGEPAAE